MTGGFRDKVVLVDHRDRVLGLDDKLEAHRHGRLHRAVSVFVFDCDGRLMLQRRHEDKYHSGGQWSNTCCTHPLPGETPGNAAVRRTYEEMGFSCDLSWRFATIYRAAVSEDLTEYEYDHVFIGHYDGDPEPHPLEVSGWRHLEPRRLGDEMLAAPHRFTPWFRMLWKRMHLSVL